MTVSCSQAFRVAFANETAGVVLLDPSYPNLMKNESFVDSLHGSTVAFNLFRLFSPMGVGRFVGALGLLPQEIGLANSNCSVWARSKTNSYVFVLVFQGFFFFFFFFSPVRFSLSFFFFVSDLMSCCLRRYRMNFGTAAMFELQSFNTSAEEARSALQSRPFGSLPVVVVSSVDSRKELDYLSYLQQLQANATRVSLFTSESDHYVPYNDPHVVIQALQSVVRDFERHKMILSTNVL